VKAGTKSGAARFYIERLVQGVCPMSARILIVEDEPLIAIDLEATLQTLGFDVCGCASNAREAVELATARRPDLVLIG
jgi:AmiR/NasT family two-component response regulator